MTEENTMSHSDIEGKMDLANVFAALLQSLGGHAEIPADLLFTNIQVDRTLVLEYNQEKNVYDVRIELVGKDELKENGN